MYVVAVTYVIKPGSEAAAAEHLRVLQDASRREPGCRMYVAHHDRNDPRRFFIYEQYDDEAAFEAHQSTPHFQEHGISGLRVLAEQRYPGFYAPLE